MRQTNSKKIQTEAARIVTGATRLVSIDSLRTETGWETLAFRRHKHKLLLFFKMKSELSPSCLSSLVPPSVGANSAYNLRNANNIETVLANSQLYYNSFLTSVIRSWNELPLETRDSYNITSFKRQLNADIVLPPDYYNAGKRLGQIYHTRLRTRCSSLNQHLFSKNITQSPLCICGVPNIFFLECSLDNNIRHDMLTAISRFCNPGLDVLLYGNPTLSNETNISIFTAIHSFILGTKRFY